MRTKRAYKANRAGSKPKKQLITIEDVSGFPRQLTTVDAIPK
jgi:hypothetical protein